MKIITAIATVFYSLTAYAYRAHAQDEWGMNELNNVNLGTNSIYDTITNLINIALGFLGVIAVGIILYGGFLWMTSGGSADRVQKAKMALISGVIGLVIIVSAYAIASFILREFGSATGVITSGEETGGGSEDPPPCDCPIPGVPKICGVSPSYPGGSAPVGNTITIQGCNFGDSGTVIFDPGGLAIPAAPLSCGGSESWSPTRIRVKVPDIAVGSYNIEVDPAAAAAAIHPNGDENFVQFTVVDTIIPSIDCLDPNAQTEGGDVEIQGSGFGPSSGDAGIYFESTDTTLAHNAAGVFWGENSITFAVPAGTITGNIQILRDDAPAPPIESNKELLTVSCSDHADCGTGCCWSNSCREVDPYCLDGSEPRITYIDPPDAGDGNIITIKGANFGSYVAGVSTVAFADGPTTASGILPSVLNANCIDLWTEDTIIIGVPADGDLPDSDTIQVSITRADDGMVSNQYGFEKRDVDRPGVCGLSDSSGFFGDTINVYGVSFDDGNSDVIFGNVVDNIGPGCGSATQCSNAVVPNLVGSNITIQVENLDPNRFISNPYPFIVEENLTGIPIINEMSPISGPTGEYITIRGANFGNTMGTVTFDANGTGVLNNFPSQCQDNIWSNNVIIAKVPDLGGADIANVDIVVTRSGDGATNEPYDDFAYESTGDPSPGLCAMEPNNGPQGYSPAGGIDLYGDNFDDGVGDDVEFFDSQIASITDWESQHITVTAVPDSAQSGDVVVNVNAAETSNPMTFNVGECELNPDNCSVAGEVCCPTPGANICLPSAQCDFGPQECEYTWEVHTVADPFAPVVSYCGSPTPWPDEMDDPSDVPDVGPIDSEEVYIDSNLSLLFNRNVFNDDLRNLDNFRLYHCDNDPTLDFTAPCINPVLVNGSLSVLNNGSDQEGLLFNPSGNLVEDSWYDVIFGDTPEGFRAQVGGDFWRDTMPGDFDWRFKTRANNDACYVTDINITPMQPASDFMYGGQRAFSALPMSDQCTICGGLYNWDYSKVINGNEAAFDLVTSTNPRNVGKFTFDSDISNPNHFPTEFLSPDHASASAMLTNIEDGIIIDSTTDAIIQNPVFRWVDRWPDSCTDACVNSEIGIRFSTPVDPGDVTQANFNVVGINNVPELVDDRTVLINGLGSDALALGTNYTININPALEDTFGGVLTNPAPWSFTTGDQGICVVDRTEITPEDLDVQIGDIIDYRATAYSAPGICYPTGQPINCQAPNCAWLGFTSSDGDVADVLNSGTGIVYASSSPPAPDNTVVIENIAVSDGVNFPANTNLTVMPGPPPPVYLNPQVIEESLSPAPGSIDVCRNEMAYVEFDMPMNESSVVDDFKFFFMNNSDLSVSFIDCYEAPNIDVRLGYPDEGNDWLCTVNYWTATPLNDLEFLARGLLLEDRRYLAGVFTEGSGIASFSGVRSSHDMYLDPLWLDGYDDNYSDKFEVDLNNDDVIDGFFWGFDVGLEECAPQRIEIIQNSYWKPIDHHIFTCADNDCPEDEDELYNDPPGPTLGNQKSFFAATFGAKGGWIMTPSLEFDWTVHNGFVDYARRLPNNDYASFIDVWPDFTGPDGAENGRDVLEVSYTMTEEPFLTLTDSMIVDVDICEVPWPDPATTLDYYWQDTAGMLASNFSTKYCQYTGYEDDLRLPEINYPPTELNNPDVDVLRDYLLIVDPNASTTAMSQSSYFAKVDLFGSLAYDSDVYEAPKEGNSLLAKLNNWKDKILGKEQLANAAVLLCDPNVPAPFNFQALIDDETDVTLTWETGSLTEHFQITRAQLPNSPVTIGTTGDHTFSDVVTPGEVYRYGVRGFQSLCPPGQQWSPYTYRIAGHQGVVDAIGVRVMTNPDNLSLEEWYQRNAPNPEVSGSMMEVDGFKAMRVGNTVYIDGVNTTNTDHMYKNIYILSYNEGAHSKTLDIFNQLINNFRLNANWTELERGTNLCVEDSSISCSNDYDCPVGNCDSRADKLRRDLIRLGDLFDMEKYLYAYGVNNMACPNHPHIVDGNECPGGDIPVPYYPLLNEGSYIQGLTNTRWPSWDANSPNDLSYYLGEDIPSDPINLFNGCPEWAEPDTCWSPTDLEFYCQATSSIYMYNVADEGRDYTIGANFEYDRDAWPPSLANKVTFAQDLAELVGHPFVVTDLGAAGLCNDNIIANPPGSIGNYCGDGVTNPPEECDGNTRDNICNLELTPYFGDQNWWNEISGGCFMEGTPNECTWYDYIGDGGYSSTTLAIMCGGYCGDGQFQNAYEQCDFVGGDWEYDNLYTCDTGPVNCFNCQALCGTEPAAVCGDGIWSSSEECDASAVPSGLSGWDCTNGATPTCNNSCEIECSDPAEFEYLGMCGDGIQANLCLGPAGCDVHTDHLSCITAGCEWAEDCDFYEYEAPSPQDTIVNHDVGMSYTCDDSCNYTGLYCRDGEQQYGFEELCDPDSYITPNPADSHEFAQYECRDSAVDSFLASDGNEYWSCTPTAGGWCGDGDDTGPGEVCDTNWPSPLPEDSDEDNQYGCNEDCSGVDGGWCGDSIVHDNQTDLPRHGLGFGESCDEGDYADRDFGVCDSVDCTWNCDPEGDGVIEGTDNVGVADLLFGGSSTEILNPGDSTILSLPACRASDRITLDMDVTVGIEVPKTAVIIITDLSYSMGYCVAGWDPPAQPGSDWTCPEKNPMNPVPAGYTEWRFYDVLGNSVAWNGSTWDGTPPAEDNDHTTLDNDSLYQERIYATTLALKGNVVNDSSGSGAIERIFERNSQAEVAMIEFAGVVDGYTDFLDISEKGILNQRSHYLDDMITGTNHIYPLERANTMIQAAMANPDQDYDNYVIIFMTDGECAQDNCEADALAEMDGIKSMLESNGKHIDVFGISLVNPYNDAAYNYNLRGFVNGLTTNECEPYYEANLANPGDTNIIQTPGSFCGDNTVDCVNDNGQYEQCDGELTCDPVTCQWIADGNKRFYDYDLEGGDLSNMYDYIAGVIPVAGVSLEIDGESHYIEIPEDTLSIPVEIDMTDLYDQGRCEEFSGNYFNFRANFDGPEGTTVTLSNGKYYFCPWRNGGAQSYY